MADKKLLFFDIDGTIWDSKNYIPESAKEAFLRLKENGHKIFICTGRAMAYVIEESLLSIGFNGIVAGCGTYVEYEGDILHEHLIEPSLLADAINSVREYGMRPILEGSDHLYLDLSEWGGDPYYKKLYRDLGESIYGIGDYWLKWPDVNKFSCDTTDCDLLSFARDFKDSFDIIIHTPNVCEVVPRGYSKASGMKLLAGQLNVSREDIFAFGDSHNDTEMLKFAGVSVAMGNSVEEIKAMADYVTTSLDQDGIYNACVHFGLI